MNAWIDSGIVLLVIMNLMLLGSSRLIACIRIVAVQGIVLGTLPLIIQTDDVSLRLLILAAVSMTLKGGIFPWLLTRAVRGADARREVEPFVGFTLSLLLGVGMLGASLMLAGKLPVSGPVGETLLAPLALMTLMVGLFMIVSRKAAVNQVLGYLAMENGIYAFGMAVAQDEPLLVELGILLDAFMAVFVMGITIYQINREFDHIDTDRLTVLKD